MTQAALRKVPLQLLATHGYNARLLGGGEA